MHILRWALVITLGTTLTGVQALAQQRNMPVQGQHQPESEADQAMMAGMLRMNHDMASAPMTGNPDHDFVSMMIPHHRGAVDMADEELRYGRDPALRRLAKEIVAAQNKEIVMMKDWQTAHPVP